MEYTLSELFVLQMGKTPSRDNAEYWEDSENRWISIADLTNAGKYISDTKESISDAAVAESGIKKIPANTVVMSFKLSLGKVAITQKEMYSNEAIMAFIDKGVTKISSEYLYYLLLAKDWNDGIHKAVMGATLNKATLSSTKIKIHEYSQQLEITKVLNHLFSCIELRKQQLSALDELIKARFVEMFGGIHDSTFYPYVPIETFATVVSGGTPNRNVSDYWHNGSIRWVKTTELQNCVIYDTEERITQEGLNNSSAKIIPPDTILIAMYGQGKTRGMSAYTAVECTTNQACACILPSEEINQKFLWQYMILSYDKLRAMAKGGNQPNLNIGIIKSFLVLNPPLSLQNKFAAFVERVDQQKQTVQQSLEKLELMKKVLMQEYLG